MEADLQLREGYENLEAGIWFVAAPGAVGKSTLAKEISARTGAIYLDLAVAETVAGNYLTGGLVKNGLLDPWRSSRTAALVDALDEARLRVTLKSFDDFLGDVDVLSKDRPFPTVIFGRVGIVEEAWLALAERGLECPIFDIDFFDPPRAKRFIVAALERLANKPGNEALASGLRSHKARYEDAAGRFVDGLQHAAASDGPRFAGYAPVLEAVANVLSGVTNPSSLAGVVQDLLHDRILQHLTDRILDREAAKLREQLTSVPLSIRAKLYAPKEQLDRLISTIYGVEVPIRLEGLPPEHAAPYDAAVGAFMPQHPFLDGTGRQPSGAVFGALLNAHALFADVGQMVEVAERRAGDGPYTPNPFLVDFYLARAARDDDDVIEVPPEHIVALYESVRARATVKEIVRLSVEGDEDSDSAEVEIQSVQAEGQRADLDISMKTSQAGVIRFGRQVNSVHIDAPQVDVVIGSGSSVEFVGPVSISVAKLSFNCPEIVVSRADSGLSTEEESVFLEAAELAESKVNKVPVVRKGVVLSVSWPGANAYPWVQFAASPKGEESEGLHEGLLRLRKLVISFRSHSKGQLARFKGKVEHNRMTKGAVGIAIRERLIRDHILSVEGPMYVLDPNMLGRIAGVTYHDLNLKRFNDNVRRYVASVVQ